MAGRLVYSGPRCRKDRGGRSAIYQPRLSFLRMGNDYGAGIQRRRRLLDANVDQFFLLLDASAAAGVVPGTPGRVWSERRLSGDLQRRIGAGGGVGDLIPARSVEADAGVRSH